MPAADPRVAAFGDGGLSALLYYHDSSGMYGTKRYSLDLVEALRGIGVRVRTHRVIEREFRLGRRRVGGLVTRAVSALAPMWGRGVVHATYHNFLPRLRRADVVTVHDLIAALRPELTVRGAKRAVWDQRNLARVVASSAEIITDSAVTRAALLAHTDVAPERVTVVHLGVHHGRFFPERWPAGAPSPFSAHRLNVLAVMDAEPRKRIDILLRAAGALPFLNVVQVGRRSAAAAGRPSELLGLETALRRQGRFTSWSAVDDASLRRLMASADVVAHPSAAEGFGLPPLEALACGAPVVVSDLPVLHEVLGDAARFVPLEVEAWTGVFASVWNGEAPRAAAFPSRARRLAHASGFTWEKTALATAAVYLRSRRHG